MKPNQTINNAKKLNLNKQTIQKLDGDKLAAVNAGEAAGTVGVGASIVSLFITEVLCGAICLATQA